jgi:hypothetical protein
VLMAVPNTVFNFRGLKRERENVVRGVTCIVTRGNRNFTALMPACPSGEGKLVAR